MQASHPSLKGSNALQLFLETSEDEFAHEVARAQNEQGSGAKKTLASTLQLFKDLSHSTANLMSGKHDDEEEDPDYIKVSAVDGPCYLHFRKTLSMWRHVALQPDYTCHTTPLNIARYAGLTETIQGKICMSPKNILYHNITQHSILHKLGTFEAKEAYQYRCDKAIILLSGRPQASALAQQ